MEKQIRQNGLLQLKALAIAAYFFALFFSLSITSHAEGTKELAPTASEFNKADMHIFDVSGGVTRDFMTYIADKESRLNIHICNPGEIMYFGFSYNTADLKSCAKLYYRIKSPSGKIVFGPQQVTNTGQGSISDYNHAVAGPRQLIGNSPTGYFAFELDPIQALQDKGFAPELGAFYIEFNPNDPDDFVGNTNSCSGSIIPVRLPLFDVTVADGVGGSPIKGRLWSQAWDLITNSFTNPFKATMYVYADDGIVTNINFNSIQPNGFIVSCNRTGVDDSGDAFKDRMSLANQNKTYGQYKIFLNDPDIDCFSSGIFGKLTDSITVTGCDQNNRCINIPVDKQGDAQLILELNGIPDYQPGTKDRRFSLDLQVGNNCLLWDSRDGLGNIVPPGQNINIQLDYYNGLTNLPMYDVENHANGFIVKLVRPASPTGTQPRLFWDDSNIPGGTKRLDGCLPGIPPNGCHTWNGTNRAPDGSTGHIPSAYGWGDLHTINTWWYANIIKATATYNVSTIIVDADASNPAGQPNKRTVCTTTPTLALNGSITGSSTTGTWSRVGGGGNFSDPGALNATYTFSTADYAAGTIKLLLTSTKNGACPPAMDTLTVSIKAGPTVSAGGPVTVCANNAVISDLGGSFGGAATGATWSLGTNASFTPNRNKPKAQYTPTAAEIALGTLTLTISSTGSGICPEVSDSKLITFSTPPTVTIGPDATVCANNAAAAVSATVNNATSSLWSGGAAGSSFADATLAATTYNPAPTEKASAPVTVTLTITASKAGCTDAKGTLKVNITPTPLINAGPSRTICANDSINLVGTRTNAPASTWSTPTSTAAAFKPSATVLSTNYKPTAADIANGSVIISLTSSGNNCTPVTDTLKLTITPAPTINAGEDKVVCANNPTTTLTATTSAAGVQWYLGPGGYSASPSSNPLTYTLNAAEVAASSTGLVVRTTGGSCPPVTDTVNIFVTPAPTVNAGPDLEACKNSATVQVTTAISSASDITWSTLNGGLFSSTTVLNPFFTPSGTDLSVGKATIILTANESGCKPVRDTVLINIAPTPIVSAGPDRSVCSNNAAVTFSGTVTNATGLIWSTSGDGKFSPGATPTATGLTPTYIPGTNDTISGGPVVITARSTGNGACAQVPATTQLTIYPAPVITAPLAATVCANNAASIALSATATNATTTTWSGGAGGTFGAVNNLNTTYSTLPAERVPGNITFTLTATRAGCNNVTAKATANITTPPTVSAGDPQTVCSDNPLVTLAGSKTIASGATWTGAGTFSDANSLTSTYMPTATEVNSGTATVTLTSTGNGNCSPVGAPMTITITKAPTIDAGNNQTVCGLNPTVALTATATGATGGDWSILTGSGTFTNGNSLSASYNAVADDLTRGYVDLRVTSSGSGTCLPVVDDIHISFTPVPSAGAGSNQTVCTTDFPVQLAGSGSVGSWTSASGNTAGFSNATALNSKYTPSAAEVAAHSATLTYATNPSAFCPAVQSQMTITIVDGPVVSPGAGAVICGNATTINLSGTVSGPSTTGGFWSTADGTGTIADPNALTTTYTISDNDITRGSVTFTLASVGSTQCNVVAVPVTYTILAPITVSAGADQNVCGLAGIPLSGTSSTGAATWSIQAGSGSFDDATALHAVFTPTVTVPGSVTLRLTTTASGSCPAQHADVTYNISPAPTVSAGSPQTICADSAFVQLAGTVTIASGIRWSKVTGSGVFSPDSVSLNSKYTPSAADRSAGTVTLRATTTGNGICSAVSADITISITPKVTIDAGTDQTLCANNAVATISGAVSGGSTTGAWTSSSGNTAGFAAPAAVNTTYTPSPADISNALVTLTFTSTANGNCKAASDQVVIRYTPAPLVDPGLPLTACASTITSGGIALSGAVTGGSSTGIWSSPTAGAFMANNTTLDAHYIPTAADTTAKSVILTLTSTNNGNCKPVDQTLLVTLAPVPLVDAGTDVTICADSFFVALNGKVNNAGGGIWSTTAGAGTFLPATTNLNANFTPSITARNNTAQPVVLTLTSTSNGPCPAASDNKIITITPAPTVSAGPDITVCANDSLVHLTGTYTEASGVQWVSNASQSFSNATSTITDFAPTALDIASHTITITIRTTNNGINTCKPVTDQMTLTITPAPVVSAGSTQTVCADIAGVPLNGAVSAGSTTGAWSTPTTGGTFSPNAATLNAVYNLAPADISNGSVVLTLTSTANGLCQPEAKSVTILITPAPTLTTGADQTICADGTASLTSSALVATGLQWSSAGNGTFSPNEFVSNPVYTPGTADTTAHSVLLTVTTTGNGTCNPVSKDITLTVNPIPIVEAGLDRVVCADVDQLVLSSYVLHATGGTWITNGNGSFNPDANTVNAVYSPSADDISSGNITLTLAATGAGTCGPVSDNLTVAFTPVPTVSAGPDVSVCKDVTSVNINASATNASNFEWIKLAPDNDNSGFSSLTAQNIQYAPSPDDKTAESVTLRITASPGGGCANVDDDMTITFVDAPLIDAGPTQTVCDSELPIKLNATGTTAKWDPAGGAFFPNDETLNATYMPSPTEIANHQVVLNIQTTNNGVCLPGSSSVIININPGPVVSAGADQTICKNVAALTLAGTANPQVTGISWSRVSSSGTFNDNTLLGAAYSPSPADYAAATATLVITSTGSVFGCKPVSDTMKVAIAPEPSLTLGPDLTVCGDATSVSLSATSTHAAAITWSNVTGSGSFNNDHSNTPVYTINTADPVPGTLKLRAEITPLASSGTCNNLADTVNIQRTIVPTVTAGTGPLTRCSENPAVELSASAITTATGGKWTSNGTGRFSPSNTTLHATYIPSDDDLNAASPSVVLTLTTTGNGQCKTYSSPITVNFDKKPILTAAPNQSFVCSGNTVNFTSAVTNGTSMGVLWTKDISNGSDGTFDDNTSFTPVYTPGAADIANGGVIIIAITTGTTTCNQDTLNMPISILSSPVALINAGFDQIVCADADTVQLNGYVGPGSQGGRWSTSTSKGLFLANDNDLSAQYIPDAADKNAGNTIVVTLTTIGNGLCAAASDDMDLSFSPIPTVSAGADMVVCADTAYLQFNPAITVATGGLWTTANGNGAFAPNSSTSASKYILSEQDRNRAQLGFTITTTGNGTCKAYESTLKVDITPKPTISLGPDRIVCAAATSAAFNASVDAPATAVLWSSSGAGTFSPNPNLATAYAIMPADTTAKIINIFAKATKANCKPIYDTLSLNFQPTPIAVAGPPISSCANVSTVDLLGAAVYNATGGKWSTTVGNGNFSFPLSQPNNIYTPSATDKDRGSVTLTFTSTGNGQCDAVSNQVLISIAASPVVTANPAILCDPALGAPLSGTVTHAAGGNWSAAIPGGSFSPDPTLLSATYFPSPTEAANGKAVLTLTSTGNGSCNPEHATIEIVIEPLPIADAGPDQYICTNGTVNLNAATIQPAITYNWAISAGAIIANVPNTQTAVPANTAYVLSAKDTKGCMVRDTMKVDVFTLPAFSITPDPLCFQENMVIYANPTPNPVVGGTYQWFRNNIILSGENKVFTNPALPGTYTIKYTYASCNVQASGTLNPPPQITTQDVIDCNSNTELKAEVITPAPPAVLTYDWAPIAGNNSTLIVPVNPNDTNLYYVTVTDPATRCMFRDSVYLIGLPVPLLVPIDSIACQGNTVKVSARPSNIPDLDQFVNNLSFSWTKNGNSDSNTDSLYFVKQDSLYVGTVAIDRCVASVTHKVKFQPYPTSLLPDNTKFCDETSVQLELIAGPDSPAYQYEWLTGNPSDNTYKLVINPTETTKYSVTITNAFGCAITDSILVRDICEPRLFQPNAFTPGCTGCANNNVFQVYGAHIGKYTISIFNRWGEVIFYSEDMNSSWDGYYLGEMMPVGVYPFIIYYEGAEEYSSIHNTVKGKVTLIR